MIDESSKYPKISVESLLDFAKKHPVLLISIGTAGLGLFALKKYYGGGVYRGEARLDGKTAIITGANIGIGKETAKDFAQRGARVILACRDITKANRAAAQIREETGNEDVLVRIVDLASLKSVRTFCEEINKTEDKIDLLVNNAGIMAGPQWQTDDGFEMQFGVNHLGHFLLTNLLMDKIKASAPSRIVNVSSLAHRRGKIDLDDVNFKKRPYDPYVAYSQSKLANILFTRELHKRYNDAGVSSFSLHPGVVVTELGRHMGGVMPKWKLTIFWLLSPIFFKNPWQGAQTSIYCSVAEGIEDKSGLYFSDCKVKEPEPQAKDDKMANDLWKLSERLVEQKK